MYRDPLAGPIIYSIRLNVQPRTYMHISPWCNTFIVCFKISYILIIVIKESYNSYSLLIISKVNSVNCTCVVRISELKLVKADILKEFCIVFFNTGSVTTPPFIRG